MIERNSFCVLLVEKLGARWVKECAEFRFAVGKQALSLSLTTEFDDLHEISRITKLLLSSRTPPDEDNINPRARVRTKQLDILVVPHTATFEDIHLWIRKNALRFVLESL